MIVNIKYKTLDEYDEQYLKYNDKPFLELFTQIGNNTYRTYANLEDLEIRLEAFIWRVKFRERKRNENSNL